MFRHRPSPDLSFPKRTVLLIAIVGVAISMSVSLARAAGESATSASPETQRVRELIYKFRQYRLFSRNEEWAQAIREIIEIGKPAMLQLIANLEHANQNITLRSLGFALRATGEARAVAALATAANCFFGLDIMAMITPRLSFRTDGFVLNAIASGIVDLGIGVLWLTNDSENPTLTKAPGVH